MRRLLTLLLFVLSLSGFSQEARLIDASQGLNNPTVYDIVQDPWGFIWIGTRDGLYRYNEGKATNISFLDSTTERRSNNVQSLLVSQDSILYIGLQLGGIVSVDLSNLSARPDKKCPQLPANYSIIALYETSDGTIWAGTSGNGSYFLRPGADRWQQLIGKIHGADISFCFDFAEQGDTLWMATTGSKLLYVLQSNNTILSALVNGEVSSFRKSVDVRGGDVVFGVEDQGLFRLNIISGAFERDATLDPIGPRDVHFDGEDLWVSTDGEGLYKTTDGRIEHYSKYQPQLGFASDQFYGIYDISDQLWLGTFNSGITVLSKSEGIVRTLPKHEDFAYSGLQSSIALLEHEGLWVGYDGDGLVRYNTDEEKVTVSRIDPSVLPVVVTSLATYGDELWVGSLSEGIFVLDDKGNLKRRYLASSGIAFGLNNSNIWSMQQTWGDSLWIGTLSGLQYWNGQEFISPFKVPWRVGRNIMDLEFTGSELWVGSEFTGLHSIDRNGGIFSVTLDNSVLDLSSYGGQLIIGTEGAGILSCREGILDTVLKNSDYTNCYALATGEHYIYATTSLGLGRIQYIDGQWEFELIREIDELQIGLPNRKSLVLKGENLYVGGTKGVAVVNVNDIRTAEVPDLLLTDVYADSEKQSAQLIKNSNEVRQPMAFNAGTKSIRFSFELMSPSFQRGVSFHYRLSSNDERWMTLPQGSRIIDLSELDPGKYTIEISATKSGVAPKVLSFDFVIKAFFWQQWWFKLILFVVITFLVGAAVFFFQDRKFRLTRLKLVETERELLKAKAAELEVKTEKQKTELSFQLLKTSSRLELLQSFKERLVKESEKKGRSEEVLRFLKGMTRELNRELQSENYWDHFERNYRELHEDFSAKLKAEYPTLTKGEIRLSYLLRQQMSNKEVANVLNVSPAAVEKAKYRLKKKLDLEKGDSLDEFIQKI
jgi:ligand-binding sensor domain-containing protein/DNA-binding CsgD family transcriptional regulator